MTTGAPWEIEGLSEEVRESVLEAARRSGLSVSEWLDQVAGHAGGRLEQRRGDNLQPAHAGASDIAEVRGRLDEVGRQLDHLARLNASEGYLRPNLRAEEPLADVISRLDRRLDHLITSGRRANDEIDRRTGTDSARDQRAPTAPPQSLELALMEIAKRQRALDGDAAPAPAPATPIESPPIAPMPDLSGLEQQLRQVTSRIETLRPCGVNDAIETLRDDLAEIGLMLKEAMPKQAIEALEVEIRGLSERLNRQQGGAGTDAVLASVESGLAEIRDALRRLTPAENLVGVEQTVQDLARKIDLIASSSQDPAAMEQLESAIVGLRGIATHVASDSALARLSEEVSGLAAKVDQIASAADSRADLLSTLEHRISSMAEALETRPQAVAETPSIDVDAIVKGLADQLGKLGLTRADGPLTGQLEDRITSLVDKLDTSNARLDHLPTIERGLADLMTDLERHRQSEGERAVAASPEVSSLRQDVRQTQSSLENVQGALELLIDRLATIENDIRSAGTAAAASGPSPVPAATLKPAAAATPPMPPAAVMRAATPAGAVPAGTAIAEHRPIDPDLPPDHPLEPGATRSRGSPLDRIAASEAALGPAKPATAPEAGGKSSFIAAARRAAQAANSEAAAGGEKRAAAPAVKAGREKAAVGWGGRVRSVLVAVSVVLIVLSSLHLVVSLFSPSEEPEDTPPTQEMQSPPGNGAAPDAPVPEAPAARPPGKQSMIGPADPPAAPPTAPVPPELVVQPQASPPGLPPAVPDVTGMIPQQFGSAPAAPFPAASAIPATEPGSPARGGRGTGGDKLPASIGGALRAAAAKGEPAAEYEIAQRYAEGRGVPQDLAEAAVWFDRAAKQGLAVAQFRLGGFYEKGFGVTKDLEAARRLYTSAADAGNAKAMHNLAVLYAEGIDAKPDYQNAAKWFRKAADYGLTDSQYNLGILYGRGIGMAVNLPEAYKWFALAARDGDRESGAKRDDVAGRMDAQSLAAAKAAVQAWHPLEQPEAATQAPAPVGGWDNAATPAPVNPKPRSSALKAERIVSPSAH
jgi:localization factor PodJL